MQNSVLHGFEQMCVGSVCTQPPYNNKSGLVLFIIFFYFKGMLHRSPEIHMRFLSLLFTFTDITNCVYVNFVCF